MIGTAISVCVKVPIEDSSQIHEIPLSFLAGKDCTLGSIDMSVGGDFHPRPHHP